MSRREAARPGRRSVVIAIVWASVATAHGEPDRVAQLARELSAVHELGPARRDQLARDVYEAARARCRADAAPPTPACLADVAATRCGSDAVCAAAADVVAANLRAANTWVDQATRAGLVRGSADYRIALAAELERRYAALAAELALDGGAGDAASIDKFCRTRDRDVHACRADDASCVPSLPWSRCSAALAWYVGSRQ